MSMEDNDGTCLLLSGKLSRNVKLDLVQASIAAS